MSTDPPYRIEPDDQNKLLRIFHASSNVEIPLDPLDPDYCDFLTWAVHQPQRPPGIHLGPLSKDLKFVATVKQVIDYFKQRSAMLNVEDKGKSMGMRVACYDRRDISYLVDHSEKAKIQNSSNGTRIFFDELCEAAAAPSGSWASGYPAQLSSKPTGLLASTALLKLLQDELKKEDSETRCLSTWPVNKTFAYFDISDFSEHPVGQQALLINQTVALKEEESLWLPGTKQTQALASMEASLCIGDGYIFVFSQPIHAVTFAAYFACLVESLVAQEFLVEMHFRIGVHTGPVYRFWDRWAPNQGRWNYVGQGVTDGQRVLSAIGRDQDDVVFISAETRRLIQAQPGNTEVLSYLQNRGRREDKHKRMKRLYELNHTAWYGSYMPTPLSLYRRKMGTGPAPI